MELNERVRGYWEQEACGTSPELIGENAAPYTLEWFENIEQHRYTVEPYIHSIAQFTRYHGKKVLEVGVGAGTDHLQWARAGAECYGVDLTDTAITTTRQRLALYGLQSNLQRIDAETLPFEDATFDVVYSWGVIHHSEKPERIIAEIKRVLKPGGVFIGMLYNRQSLVVLKLWVKYALLQGKPWRSFADLVWNHMESVGTKAYTVPELTKLFSSFQKLTAQPVLTIYDTGKIPSILLRLFSERWGWFVALRASK